MSMKYLCCNHKMSQSNFNFIFVLFIPFFLPCIFLFPYSQIYLAFSTYLLVSSWPRIILFLFFTGTPLIQNRMQNRIFIRGLTDTNSGIETIILFRSELEILLCLKQRLPPCQGHTLNGSQYC
jgi:hypothetical protein